MVIAQITTDNREPFREYDKPIPWFGTAPEALLQGFAQTPEVQVHVISCAQRPMVSSPEKLADNIWFHSVVVPKMGWLRTGYQGCIRAVRRKLREIRPDIVHGQGTERDCAISAVLSGYPNVLTIHGNMQIMAQMQRARPFSFYWLAARLERLCLARTNGVVCITDYTRRAVEDLARQTWIVPNAVDGSFFEIANRPAAVPEILCVGNIGPRKNQNAFIHAMEGVPEMRDCKLFFLGLKPAGDPYAEEFGQLVAERSWCSYEGFADREKLKDYFSRASLLVLPSLEDNCPMVVLEAMAAGVPAVAGAVGGVPELIEDGVTGWLCDPTDKKSMQTVLGKIFSQSAQSRTMAHRAKQRARSRFHPRVIADRHSEIYREVLDLARHGCKS